MPLPDTLPLEIWYRIVKLGRISMRDYRSMLAVAPQTTARNMHDAAFSILFKSFYIGFGEDIDPKRLALKLSSYLDSLPFRSTVRYLQVHISTERWVDIDGPGDPWIESQRRAHIPPELDDLICDVLSALPNITKLDWCDMDHVGSRKERRWGCMRSCLPQLTELTFRRYEFGSPLDLRTANTLQSLSLQHCQFYPQDDGPWIISDARIQTLTLHIEDIYPKTSPMRFRGTSATRPTNIFSRLNLSSVATFYLKLPSPSEQDVSCLLTGSLSNDGLGLGVNLQSLFLCKIGLSLALALGNMCSFPCLRSCYLECLSSSGTQYLVRPLCLFLNRQVSLEKLECAFSEFDMALHEAALCLEDVVNMLYRLKDLKYLKISGFAFSLDHPALRIAPLAQLQVLSIRSTKTAPLTEIAGIVAEKLRSYPTLRSFHWHVLMQPTIGPECHNFVKTLKHTTSQIEFAQVQSMSFWLRNDGPEPHRILPGERNQSYQDLQEMYRYRTYWGDYYFQH